MLSEVAEQETISSEEQDEVSSEEDLGFVTVEAPVQRERSVHVSRAPKMELLIELSPKIVEEQKEIKGVCEVKHQVADDKIQGEKIEKNEEKQLITTISTEPSLSSKKGITLTLDLSIPAQPNRVTPNSSETSKTFSSLRIKKKDSSSDSDELPKTKKKSSKPPVPDESLSPITPLSPLIAKMDVLNISPGDCLMAG